MFIEIEPTLFGSGYNSAKEMLENQSTTGKL
jgi:hypothetical protein